MADPEPIGVKINLISSRKLDTMTSQEKLRFILDEVKKGSVLVLERGLTAEEEIDLIKATMSEINHNTFIGIEMQSYSSRDLETSSWLSRILGRTRVPKMSVIGPASLLKTIHKDGSMIQTMVLTGESISREMPEEILEYSGERTHEAQGELSPEPESGAEQTTPYESTGEEGDGKPESMDTAVAPEQETTDDVYYDNSLPRDQDFTVPVETAPEEARTQEPAEATPLSLDDIETARGSMEYAEPYNPPMENPGTIPEEPPGNPVDGNEHIQVKEPVQQENVEYPTEPPAETLEQEQPSEGREGAMEQELPSKSEPHEQPQQESVGFLYRRLKTED